MATKFGEYLENKLINKSELGRKAGITRQRISELSVRENANMKLDEACAIAKVLGIKVDDLCRITGLIREEETTQ